MKGLPRATFEQVVKKHNADKYSKRFRHWDHLVAMLYAQLSGTTGLRPLQTAFNSHQDQLYHLGTKPLKKSTLADANEKRSETVFGEIATWLMGQVAGQIRKDSKELMFLLDSTSVTLKGREFDRWTSENRTRNTQGIKLHVLLESTTKTPSWTSFTAANVNDVELARDIELQDGALYVFDKGYCDYNWWYGIGAAGARFVTRFKYNAGLSVVEVRDIPAEAQGIVLSDELVKFKNKYPGGKRNAHFEKPLRRVTVVRSANERPIVLATNDLVSSALEIAERYKERWAIELFFKWIKQHLKIKSFLGRTQNAVRIQILTALISYLLVAIYKQRHSLKQSLWDCLCFIRVALFQYFDPEESNYRKRRRDEQYAAEMQSGLF